MAAALDEASGMVRPGLVRRERADAEPLPASFAQQRLWFLNRLEGRSATYNIPVALRLRGALDPDALEQALNDVVGRHESLRTVFTEVDGTAVQQVRDMPGAGIELKASPVAEDELAEALDAAAGEGFDLACAEPLIRAHLFEVAAGAPEPDGLDEPVAGEWVLMVVMHHAVTDGWSMAPFARDLSVAYAARCQGRVPGWAALPVQYADYALWQREVLGSQDDPGSLAVPQISYWAQTLRAAPEELTLPAVRAAPGGGVAPGGQVAVGVEREGAPAAGGAGAREPRDVVHGVAGGAGGPAVPVECGHRHPGRHADRGADRRGSGRPGRDVRQHVGAAHRPVRRSVFAELIGRVRETDLAAFAHQDLPFEQLVDVLKPARRWRATRCSRFSWSCRTPSGHRRVSLDLPGLTCGRVCRSRRGAAKFDLTLSVSEQRDGTGTAAGMRGILSYSIDLFDPADCRADSRAG